MPPDYALSGDGSACTAHAPRDGAAHLCRQARTGDCQVRQASFNQSCAAQLLAEGRQNNASARSRARLRRITGAYHACAAAI
ncbi:hypothetical protein BI312_08805 [Xanthomonas citri pv. citri]|uniref:Uncharacterized protein n=2 Tax=Xanthomonas TaxID=338 RepID=A0AA44YZ38_XANCM|nr:hypothetical protein XAC29_17930 [Xanthomonas axonopodis Xac29-1]AKM26433.1 hypothetical protein AB890_17735 [Xanthomonas citri pv. citri]AOL20723.1 hypothetical protein BGK55_17445 [Xanthomonas citri pv. malvacearum]NMI15075.1 hypothetical protein [Xanthomonas citri]OOW60687.1 hypothetical protein Xcnt_18850 [Xanthomonas campestris pv. centellae]OOW83680.1 hypothetical protein Xclt_10225 [Xanthomonas axonopodis pv. clitoriae]CCG39353.1 hypothetical protein XMIN_4345 [Xanthomonas citri pv.